MALELRGNKLVMNNSASCDFERSMGITYQEAKEFLAAIGRWDEVKDQDGFTIVSTATFYRSQVPAELMQYQIGMDSDGSSVSFGDLFYCSNRRCSRQGEQAIIPWRNCGNRQCCKIVGTHYPFCSSCQQIMTQVTSAPSVIWTGNIGPRYRSKDKEGYHGDSGGEDGFWAWTRNTPDKKPQPVRINTWQDAREFAKANGCADPRELGSNQTVSADGKSLDSGRGMPGQEI